MKIITGDAESAIEVIREAAVWLINSGHPLWTLEELTREQLIEGISEENFITGWLENVPVVAMILQWHDPVWKNINLNESGFIHKLSVRRSYSGKGYAKELIRYAESECIRKKRPFLRLDCSGEREKLRRFYESQGFVKVDRRLVGIYDMAFYEKKLSVR